MCSINVCMLCHDELCEYGMLCKFEYVRMLCMYVRLGIKLCMHVRYVCVLCNLLCMYVRYVCMDVVQV